MDANPGVWRQAGSHKSRLQLQSTSKTGNELPNLPRYLGSGLCFSHISSTVGMAID